MIKEDSCALRLYALIFSTFAGFHPRTSKSWETTRAPGFNCFSSFGLSMSFAPVSR